LFHLFFSGECESGSPFASFNEHCSLGLRELWNKAACERKILIHWNNFVNTIGSRIELEWVEWEMANRFLAVGPTAATTLEGSRH
jgi:hypothetical protein